jgi:hypothetical protein
MFDNLHQHPSIQSVRQAGRQAGTHLWDDQGHSLSHSEGAAVVHHNHTLLSGNGAKLFADAAARAEQGNVHIAEAAGQGRKGGGEGDM